MGERPPADRMLRASNSGCGGKPRAACARDDHLSRCEIDGYLDSVLMYLGPAWVAIVLLPGPPCSYLARTFSPQARIALVKTPVTRSVPIVVRFCAE